MVIFSKRSSVRRVPKSSRVSSRSTAAMMTKNTAASAT